MLVVPCPGVCACLFVSSVRPSRVGTTPALVFLLDGGRSLLFLPVSSSLCFFSATNF